MPVTIRQVYTAVAVKLESTAGTDAIADSPVIGDFIGCTAEVRYNNNLVNINEATGSMDPTIGMPGMVTADVTIRMPLRGFIGSLAGGPEWDRLLRCCTMARTHTSSAVGAPTAATAGTSSTITLATPFGTTAQQYRGMPLNLAGDQTATTVITDYTTGRVATYGTALTANPTTSTTAQIPPNLVWAPTSDEANFSTCTIYLYQDSHVTKVVGCTGSWTIELEAGQIGYITFTMRGTPPYSTTTALNQSYTYYVASPPVATAQAAAALRGTPARWAGGLMQWFRLTMMIRSLRISCNVGVTMPDNPETVTGVDAAVPISREIVVEADPLQSTNSSVNMWQYMVAGTAQPLVAKLATLANANVMITLPASRIVSLSPGARNGLTSDTVRFAASGVDAGVYIAHW